MAYIPQGTRETSVEHDLVCTVKFDEDLPNGPFVEGSAGNTFSAGNIVVSVPQYGTTWGQIADLVVRHHQAECDSFNQNGKKKSISGGQWKTSTITTITPVSVKYKGGIAPNNGEAREGSCTVRLSIVNAVSSEALCCSIM